MELRGGGYRQIRALKPLLRVHHFLAGKDFNASISNIAAVSSFFRSPFLSSKVLSRLVSDTSIPPSLDFHLYYVASENKCLRRNS